MILRIRSNKDIGKTEIMIIDGLWVLDIGKCGVQNRKE